MGVLIDRVKKKYKLVTIPCSKERFKARKELLSSICIRGSLACERDGRAARMEAMTCIEAVAELTKLGWPWGNTKKLTVTQ